MVLSGGGLEVPWYGFDGFVSCAPSATAVAASKAYTSTIGFIPVSSRQGRKTLDAFNPEARGKSRFRPGLSYISPKISVSCRELAGMEAA
jgi:hypothetical protein